MSIVEMTDCNYLMSTKIKLHCICKKSSSVLMFLVTFFKCVDLILNVTAKNKACAQLCIS